MCLYCFHFSWEYSTSCHLLPTNVVNYVGIKQHRKLCISGPVKMYRDFPVYASIPTPSLAEATSVLGENLLFQQQKSLRFSPSSSVHTAQTTLSRFDILEMNKLVAFKAFHFFFEYTYFFRLKINLFPMLLLVLASLQNFVLSERFLFNSMVWHPYFHIYYLRNT